MRRGAVSLPEDDARAIAVAVARDLAQRNQITEVPQPAAVLAALTAHHVLERADYPGVSFRFGHQQFQERYAALGIRVSLLALAEGDTDGLRRYTADYVNEPAWARAAADGRGNAWRRDRRCGGRQAPGPRAAAKLLEMALAVDVVFAGELAHLCGAGGVGEARQSVGDRLRGAPASPEERFRDLAVAAMLATGSDDFQDIVVPLLSSADRETRLGTYRLWPDLSVSSLGPDWRKESAPGLTRCVRTLSRRCCSIGSTPRLRLSPPPTTSPAVKMACAEALAWTGRTMR